MSILSPYTLLRCVTSPPRRTLTVLQPTPSTTSFTVSTRTVPRTLPALLLYYVFIILRILVGALAIVVLWAKWRAHKENAGEVKRVRSDEIEGTSETAWESLVLKWVIGEELLEMLFRSVERVDWMYFGPGVLGVMWWVVRRGYTEESLLVLRGLGIQTSTSSSTYLQPPVTRFIPTTSIQDIFIHEAFKGSEVRFYLAIVVRGEEAVVVVFPHLLPRRHVLEEVWRGARACLYEPGSTTKL
ncbi:hypothetical protein GQ43DRAFT_450721 [Delitschia confertaspora ATCC 74209]|uniref:Phosphatidylinositol N-acetylglucosaminyltransferase subunit H conserved domain-containing protein n=1 Tax=Delitschia confertaspora ATCC 74209 TaxID=1513339 RepID=A0A9P4JGT0_9PLEO|nr:hypothetical protein GQ43DRAFT_450721 [Delitschia confertaspora ATCC 74209]